MFEKHILRTLLILIICEILEQKFQIYNKYSVCELIILINIHYYA